MPHIGGLVTIVDVIAKSLFEASVKIGALVLKARIAPVLVIGHFFRYLHDKNQVSCEAVRCRSSAHNPIANIGASSNYRLTSCEGAYPMKRIRRKPIITRDNIRVKSHCGPFSSYNVVMFARDVRCRRNLTNYLFHPL